MAIYHLSMKPVSRASGRSAVAAAAYRAGECLTNERDGETHDFTRRQGVEHAEILLPAGVEAAWALDRSRLWNAAEKAEKRSDARVAREFEIALPHELSADQRLELARSFAQDLADRTGAGVDLAIHAPHGETDIRNHHAHILITTRRVEASGLGGKTVLERENKWLLSQGLPTAQMQLREIRESWEHTANAHLARAGHEMRIDHRSHRERGLEIEPSEHMGVHASQMQRRGESVMRRRIDPQAAQRNTELIRQKPETVLTLITTEKSVFDRHDVARALHRAIDDRDAFQSAFAAVMASPALVELQPERRDARGQVLELARYSTREMVQIERGMAESAERMKTAHSYGVAERRVEAVLERRSYLAEEQREAVRHLAGPERISAVVGLAGAGKSTMLAAAREAWEAQGYRVRGAALSGKAAEGLEESAGIASRTLASYEHGWQAGRDTLNAGDVFVIDEAGMVSSRQMARFVQAADEAGAKIVLVGDPEQLQPIEAGAAFRAVAERIGFAGLEEVRRQQEGWQQQASKDLAQHRTVEALNAYDRHGAMRLLATQDEAWAAIVRDVMADRAERPEGSRIVLAHRRADVHALNQAIRTARQKQGELHSERVYETNEGQRAFAPGDRIVFLENDRTLKVKNGMLGTIIQAEAGALQVRLDSGRDAVIPAAQYQAFDHGYATTIHKSQGATVDRAFVLASESMDRHLTYVAMTRHRESAVLYAGRDTFADTAVLTQRLSRANGKETTLDYAERRGLAERLGLGAGIAMPESAQTHTLDPQRSPVGERQPEGERQLDRPRMFDGLRAGLERRARPGEQERTPQIEPYRVEVLPDRLVQAVTGYVQAHDAAQAMKAQNLPVLPHQAQDLKQAKDWMEQALPGSFDALQRAVDHDAGTLQALHRRDDPVRSETLAQSIRREQGLYADPQVRVQRFVEAFERLETERAKARPGEERAKVEMQMRESVKALEHDQEALTRLRDDPLKAGVREQSTLARALQHQDVAQSVARQQERQEERRQEREQDRERERSRDRERQRGWER